MSEGKSVAREISELAELGRALAAKPLGQSSAAEQMAYYERKRDLFRRIAATSPTDEKTATESAEAAEAAEAAENELQRLRRAEEPGQ